VPFSRDVERSKSRRVWEGRDRLDAARGKAIRRSNQRELRRSIADEMADLWQFGAVEARADVGDGERGSMPLEVPAMMLIAGGAA
jgi:hypothetical protein